MYKYIDNYLMHYGVKGMKWKNHKTRLDPNRVLDPTYNDQVRAYKKSDKAYNRIYNGAQITANTANKAQNHVHKVNSGQRAPVERVQKAVKRMKTRRQVKRTGVYVRNKTAAGVGDHIYDSTNGGHSRNRGRYWQNTRVNRKRPRIKSTSRMSMTHF